MKLALDSKVAIEGREMLDILPELYFSVLKNIHIEEKANLEITCSYELPNLGKRTKTASTARDAIRAVLFELSELVTNKPTSEWQFYLDKQITSIDASNLKLNVEENNKPERFQSKPRQFTIGVTMPVKLKETLQNMAEKQRTSFAEISRQLTSIGFEDFEERIFSEDSEKLLSTFMFEVGTWGITEAEQVMVRLDPKLAVQVRTTAKEFRKSASEFGAMCLAHGHFLETQLADVEVKVKAVQGSRLRDLSPKIGLDSHVVLLSGVLAGTIEAPSRILRSLSEVFAVSELALSKYFKVSFDNRAVPAFKSEGKPQLACAPQSWQEAVEALQLSPDQTRKLSSLKD